ncbi:unnamed protein product [Schistocephalus solidus]|uniref:Uncharacterized protein n=1 Tax=Schistocephalus solidus TaxID=70667 RepID=A0A183SHR8_SCHSO|nr:unnamed protein product [Schistocephalus solidus]
MLLCPPLTGIQLSPVVPHSWVLPTGHNPGNRHDRRAKLGEGLRCGDWFDDNDADISNLLVEKNGLHIAYMDLRTDATKAAFFRCRCPVQQRLREMQDASAEEIQGSVLNCSSAISDAAIDRLPQVNTNTDLDLPPSLTETIQAVQQISSGKALGSHAVPLEVYKHGGPGSWQNPQHSSKRYSAKDKFLRISKTRPSSISTNVGGTANFVITTVASRCSASP